MTRASREVIQRHRLEDARDIGWNRGFKDIHYESRNFQTGAEYLAWLAGWRAGQAKRSAIAAQALATTQQSDEEMRLILEALT